MAKTKPNIFYAWAEAGATTDPGAVKTQAGWVSEIPTYQNFNWLLNRMDQFNQHVNEKGIPEWDSTTVYIKGSKVTGSDRYTYKSQIAANNGNDPVGDSGANWVLDTIDEMWFDQGHTVDVNSGDTLIVNGLDVRANYIEGTRIKLEGPANGVAYAEVASVLFLAGNTFIALNVDDKKILIVETLDYLKISTIDKNNINWPFGLSGLSDSASTPTVGQSILRNTPVSSAVSSKMKLILGPPDTSIDVHTNGVAAPNTFLNEASFFKMNTDLAIPTDVNFTNLSAITLNVRYSINKAAWVTNNLASLANLNFTTIGTDGILEIVVCNKDTTNPKEFTLILETDNTGKIFVRSTIMKNHFIP